MKHIVVFFMLSCVAIIYLPGCSDINYPTDALDKDPNDMSGGSIVIDGGAPYAYSQQVTISCMVDNAVEMQFSQDLITWSTLEAFSNTRMWILPLEYGQQTVYGQFINSRGDTVIYDDSIFFIERLIYQPGTYLGGDVDISDDGNVIAAGSYEGNANAVYVFRKQAIDWDCTVIKPDDISTGDKFGFSVALSGDANWLFVGAPVKKAVYVYEYTGGWQLRQTITSTVDHFGHTIATSYDRQFITVASASSVFAYKYNSNTNQYGSFTVNGSYLINVCNVMISNDGVWIFAAYYNTNTGGVMSFVRTNDYYGNPKSIKPDDYQPYSYFGESIALSSDSNYLIIGAPYYDINADDDKGCFYVYQKSGSAYTLISQQKNTDGANGDALGKAVSVSPDGRFIIASMPLADGEAVDRGRVLVYQLNTGSLDYIDTFYPDDRNSKCYFGESLAISNNGVLAIGAPYAYVNSMDDNSGVVYIRRL